MLINEPWSDRQEISLPMINMKRVFQFLHDVHPGLLLSTCYNLLQANKLSVPWYPFCGRFLRSQAVHVVPSFISQFYPIMATIVCEAKERTYIQPVWEATPSECNVGQHPISNVNPSHILLISPWLFLKSFVYSKIYPPGLVISQSHPDPVSFRRLDKAVPLYILIKFLSIPIVGSVSHSYSEMLSP